MPTAHASSALLREERRDAVALLRIDRPPLNLLNQELREALGDRLATLAGDAGVRAVVLTSAGEHFCAGADMSEFPLRFDPMIAREHWQRAFRMTMHLLACPKPTIAAIRGACLGGGLELALACDFRIAAGTARLGLPEIGRGIHPGTGGTLLLSRLIGDAAAKRLILAGEVLAAEAAVEQGFVERSVDDAQVLDQAQAFAQELAGRPALAVSAAKRLIDAPFLELFARRAEAERDAYIAAFQADDASEGNRAFFEKRAPAWSHR